LQTKNLNYIYNPANLTEQEVVDNFVIRKKEFRRIFNDIKSSDMKYPEQHYIIEGQRGYGKTTLLQRIYIEIKNDKNLNTWLIPIIFPEEQYGIRKLFKLWETTTEYLEKECFEFQGLYDEIDEYSDREDYEDICFKILEQKLKSNNKKLILLIDNIGDILKKFKVQEQQKLREILLTSAEIRIIGASSEVLEYTFNYSNPFFDFFKQIRLKGLSKEDTEELLKNLGQIFNKKHILSVLENNKGKIEALRRLTGGVPRTMVLLFDIFVDDSGEAFKELDEILDRVTPLYKHRMDNLSPVQQELIDVIALNWDAVSSKEIAEKTRMTSKEVSAQLKQLDKNGLINKIPINRKNYMYQIKERFFNIWYLMRFGGKRERNKICHLVRFLENWCSREELENKALNYIDSLKAGKLYESLKTAQKAVEMNNNFINNYYLALTLLWNDLIEKSLGTSKILLQSSCNTNEYNEYINEYFIFLMAKKQYNSLFKIFDQSELKLKDKFKPTYYALMYFMKDQDAKFEVEYRKIGEELEETVEEIIDEVNNLEEMYGIRVKE
jgi:DNA-binding transcriptional regulator GbsR (MarR family)/nucleoside-triphosphatase THEP1